MKEDEKMAVSKNKLYSNKKYNDKTYEQLGFRSRKDKRLGDLIEAGAYKTGKTKSVYMIDSINAQLMRDGITIDMLDKQYTPPAQEAKQLKQYMIYMVTSIYLADDYKLEEYVSVFQTIAMAKKYIANKFSKKAHPEDWQFIIYGRCFEANNKLEAANMHRQLLTSSEVVVDDLDIDTETDFEFEEFDIDLNVIHKSRCLERIDKYRKPDYMEVVNYKEV